VGNTGSASVPAQSYTEGVEIDALVLPAARGGDGRLTYALSPSLPEGLRLNRGTTPQAATRYTWTATDADGDAVIVVSSEPEVYVKLKGVLCRCVTALSPLTRQLHRHLQPRDRCRVSRTQPETTAIRSR